MRSTQKTIGIDAPLWYELDEWLKSDQAQKRGFHSKAQFANFAIGDYLIQYKKHGKTPTEQLLKLQATHAMLQEKFEAQLKFVDKLERFWFKHNFANIEQK